MTTCIYVSP